MGHVNAGIIYSYGNSDDIPYSESFYAGGANSVRAFGVREIGPGAFDGRLTTRQGAYLMQNGDIKFVANLEYRTNLFGNLNGAVFLDAGNVWNRRDFEMPSNYDELDANSQGFLDDLNWLYRESSFRLKRMFWQTALGTGIGLRYNLGFLVIRLDWGIALHCPYETSKSGYFNVDSFKDAHTLHFAVGYPF